MRLRFKRRASTLIPDPKKFTTLMTGKCLIKRSFPTFIPLGLWACCCRKWSYLCSNPWNYFHPSRLSSSVVFFFLFGFFFYFFVQPSLLLQIELKVLLHHTTEFYLIHSYGNHMKDFIIISICFTRLQAPWIRILSHVFQQSQCPEISGTS